MTWSRIRLEVFSDGLLAFMVLQMKVLRGPSLAAHDPIVLAPWVRRPSIACYAAMWRRPHRRIERATAPHG